MFHTMINNTHTINTNVLKRDETYQMAAVTDTSSGPLEDAQSCTDHCQNTDRVGYLDTEDTVMDIPVKPQNQPTNNDGVIISTDSGMGNCVCKAQEENCRLRLSQADMLGNTAERSNMCTHRSDTTSCRTSDLLKDKDYHVVDKNDIQFECNIALSSCPDAFNLESNKTFSKEDTQGLNVSRCVKLCENINITQKDMHSVSSEYLIIVKSESEKTDFLDQDVIQTSTNCLIQDDMCQPNLLETQSLSDTTLEYLEAGRDIIDFQLKCNKNEFSGHSQTDTDIINKFPSDSQTDAAELQQDVPNADVAASCVSVNDMGLSSEQGQLLLVSSVVADMKEIHNQLVSLTADISDDSLGLPLLFSQTQRKTEKSKSARKRKKQLQKIKRIAPSKATSSSRFAQSTEELVFGRDIDVDGSLTCPVCLELYYLPRSCVPCGHIFCDPCLRRLTVQGWEEVPCPLCRTTVQACDLQEEFDQIVRSTHPDVYASRLEVERRSRFRHYRLPFMPPVPLGRRLIRHLRTTSRARQSDASWMSHDWFKFLLGCTVGVCTSMLIMLLNRVKSINDVRDVNIMFLSLILGASLTVVVFKLFKIS